MNLAELIAPGTRDTTLHFVDEGVELTLGDLWSEADYPAQWMSDRGSEPVAAVLTNSCECTKVVLGSILAGTTLVSVAPPPRGTDIQWYADFVERACLQSECNTLVVEEEYLEALPPRRDMQYRTFQQLCSGASRSYSANPERFTLVQYTSGSTADPKGIVLTQEKIVANLLAILGWLQPGPGESTCSWLPLSHDMGLIGMFLAALAGAGPQWGNGIDIVLLTPEGFLRSPQRWIDAMSHFGSTITSAPNFAFDMVLRRPVSATTDLGRLRVCITGAEPVRPDSLEAFSAALAASGFRSRSFCPAYGLAECALAVTATPTEEHWHARTLDPQALAEGYAEESKDGIGLVASGRPLSGFEVRVSDAGVVGEIAIRGPSVATQYSNGSPISDGDRWLHTSDLGFMHEGELFVVGRSDDVFQVAGRKVYAGDLEWHAGSVAGIRSGRAVALNQELGVQIVAELDVHAEISEIPRLIREVVDKVRERSGIAINEVLIVQRGHLPMTSSGKIQRKAVAERLGRQSLEVLNVHAEIRGPVQCEAVREVLANEGL